MAIRKFAAIARRAADPVAPRRPAAQPQPEVSTGPLAVLVAALALAAIFAPACSSSESHDTVGQLGPNARSFHIDKAEPLVEVGAPKYPRGLVVQSDGDTRTSLVDGRNMAKALGSVLIVGHNEGAHGLYAADPANACVNETQVEVGP